MRSITLVLVLMLLATLGCSLTSGDAEPTALIPAGKPIVTIRQPAALAAFRVGDTVTVQAEATDPNGTGVTRVELRVNNVVVDSQTSQVPQGESNLSVLLDYIAAVPSPQVVLAVRAYRGNSAVSDDATVTISVGTSTGTTSNTATPFGSGSSTGGSSTSGGNTGAQPAPYNPQCRARVDVTTLNMRRGPSTDYDILSRLSVGNEVPLVGRLSDNSWWEVTSGGQRGWVSAAYTSLLGECGTIAVTTPPASPTPRATITLTPQPNAQANLIVSLLTGNTNIVLTGGEVAASYILRVKNVGGTAAGAFNVSIFYPDGSFLDYVVPSLAPGEERTIDAATAKFKSVGTYRLAVQVDSSGNISESNKTDNQAFLDIVVVAPTPTPEGQ